MARLVEENVCGASAGSELRVRVRCLKPKLTLWFEVAVDEAHEMQILERRDNFGRVEFGVLFRQTLPWPCLKRSKEFAAHAILHT